MRLKKYYPWIVCAACVLLHFCICGMAATAFSTYMPFLKASANLSNTETSMITTIRCLTTMIAMIFSEKFYQKLSLRLGVFIACLLMPVSCIIFAAADSAMMCYAGAVVMGISYAFGTMIPIALIIRNWFISYHSTALAIAVCGSGFSIAVTPPVITYLVENAGLKMAFYVEALFITIVAVILLLVIRDKPEDLKMEPYQAVQSKAKAAKRKAQHSDIEGTEVVFFIIIMFLLGCSGTPYTHHLTIHYVTAGYSSVQAATAFSIYGAVLIGAKILFGVCADRFGTYRVNFVYTAAWTLASFVTAIVNGTSLGLLYTAGILNGIGITVATVGMTVWCGDLSSEGQYAKRVKLSQTLYQLGSLLGSGIPGILADITGSYAPSYMIFTVIQAVIMVTIQVLYKRHMKRASSLI